MSFDDLISYENIYIAFKRLQTTSRDYYKNLYWNDLYNFGLDLEKNINTLIHLLKEDLYKPNKSYKIYFPKSTGLVRPISVLNFIDLLVYQAIVNLLAEKFYKSFHSYYNHFVFGNIYNKTNNENKIFFYKHWKQQWKKYENLTKQHYNDGYEYITEFDLASFYDTVDHYLVKNLLKEKNIDKKIIDILSSQLLSWNKNQTQNQGFKHGIPQGPLGSGFIAEICLHNIDKKMRKLVLENRNIRYMRYVDDIRIFTKDKYLAQKNIVYLDLLARELGFIPQANKTKVKKVDNIHLYIKTNKDFSRVASEYKEKGELSPSNNRKYTKRLIKNLKSGNYDKTLIKFGLFKVKGNEELKNLLIDKYKDLYPYIEAVCFYLSKYFINDKKVIEWVNNLIYKKKIIYKYIIAVFFEFFYEIIKFDYKIIDKYYYNSEDWYISYFLLDWIYHNEPDWLNNLNQNKNLIVERKRISLQYNNINQTSIKNSKLTKMIKSENNLIALNGLRLYYDECINSCFNSEVSIDIKVSNNTFIKNIAEDKTGFPVSYILDFLKKYDIKNGEEYFRLSYFSEDELNRLKYDLKESEKYKEVEPIIWLIKIDLFNHLIVKKTLEICGEEVKQPKKYGNILNMNFFVNKFPISYKNFSEIHELRNKVAHPFKDDGSINNESLKINYRTLKRLERLEIKSLKEIINSFKYVSDLSNELVFSKE